jgi:hypothetical protein
VTFWQTIGTLVAGSALTVAGGYVASLREARQRGREFKRSQRAQWDDEVVDLMADVDALLDHLRAFIATGELTSWRTPQEEWTQESRRRLQRVVVGHPEAEARQAAREVQASVMFAVASSASVLIKSPPRLLILQMPRTSP